jgi:DnaJ-class molecular chaperone
MPKRDLYRILGISNQAAPAEIEHAYHRIVFVVHPETGERPDPEYFHEVHDAYEIISVRDRRRFYEIDSASRRRPFSAEPQRSRSAVTLIDDFLTVRPSVEELLDQIGQNFFGQRLKSGGPLRRIGAEVILSAEEARFGCRVPFRLPSFAKCARCDGAGVWWAVCPDCYGRGLVQSTREVTLEIRPGVRDRQRFEVDFGDVGIGNLLLEVRVIVT